MQIDQLPSYVLTIAATNHAELLDRAIWRRFQLRMAFPSPQKTEVAAFLEKIIASWPEQPKISVGILAGRLNVTSYAEARDFCQNVRRRHILGLGEINIDSAIKTELDLWAARVKPEVIDADRPNQTTPSVKRRPTTNKTNRNT